MLMTPAELKAAAMEGFARGLTPRRGCYCRKTYDGTRTYACGLTAAYYAVVGSLPDKNIGYCVDSWADSQVGTIYACGFRAGFDAEADYEGSYWWLAQEEAWKEGYKLGREVAVAAFQEVKPSSNT
jgi:hypothetical protein